MNKYGAKKTIVDNIKFDSRAESLYYSRLKLLEKAKRIKEFECQPEFVLLPSFKKNGKSHRGIKYVADFKVIHLDGSVEIIDVKGVRTDVYKMKKKMFEYTFPDLTITEVSV